MTKRKAIILRGPSGCGKSTVAKRIAQGQGAVICSADDEHIDPNTGEYVFNPARIAEAHSRCLTKFMMAVREPDVKVVVLDNTNIRHWEYHNYQIIAACEGMMIDILEWRVETLEELRWCIERNQHGVPPEVVTRMAMEFEPNVNGIPQLISQTETNRLRKHATN